MSTPKCNYFIDDEKKELVRLHVTTQLTSDPKWKRTISICCVGEKAREVVWENAKRATMILGLNNPSMLSHRLLKPIYLNDAVPQEFSRGEKCLLPEPHIRNPYHYLTIGKNSPSVCEIWKTAITIASALSNLHSKKLCCHSFDETYIVRCHDHLIKLDPSRCFDVAPFSEETLKVCTVSELESFVVHFREMYVRLFREQSNVFYAMKTKLKTLTWESIIMDLTNEIKTLQLVIIDVTGILRDVAPLVMQYL